MGDYLQGSDTMLSEVREHVHILGAHRDAAPGLPRLSREDVEDLRNALIAIRDGTAKGSGMYPREYRVNDRIQLLAEPRLLQEW
jgi:hypothetical protein